MVAENLSSKLNLEVAKEKHRIGCRTYLKSSLLTKLNKSLLSVTIWSLYNFQIPISRSKKFVSPTNKCSVEQKNCNHYQGQKNKFRVDTHGSQNFSMKKTVRSSFLWETCKLNSDDLRRFLRNTIITSLSPFEIDCNAEQC